MTRTFTSTGAKSPRRTLNLLAASALLAMSAAVALPSVAQPVDRGDVPTWRHGSPGEHRMEKRAKHQPGHRADRALDRQLDGLNVTDAQRTQIKQIWQDARKDLHGQRESRRALETQRRALLSAATLDEAAFEKLRQQQVAQQDQASRRLAQAQLAAAKVLTAEQRAQLAQREKLQAEQRRERGERMRKHHEQLRQKPAAPIPGAATR